LSGGYLLRFNIRSHSLSPSRLGRVRSRVPRSPPREAGGHSSGDTRCSRKPERTTIHRS
jgi:hypothetical protein